jgi:hypothetical protein
LWLRREHPILSPGGRPGDVTAGLSVVAFAPGHGVERAAVAKEQILASQSNTAGFCAIAALLAAALTPHDAALRAEAGCVRDQAPAAPPSINTR